MGILSHHGTSDNAVVALEWDELVGDVDGGRSVLAGLHIAEVAGVAAALGIGRCSVLAAIDVEVRPGWGATVGVVAKL